MLIFKKAPFPELFQSLFLINVDLTIVDRTIHALDLGCLYIDCKALRYAFLRGKLDCQHFFRQIFLGYFSDIVQAFDTLRKNVCGDDYTSLHNPIVLSSVLPAYGMFHSIQILLL